MPKRDSKLHYFSRRLKHGRHCFIALDGVKLAAYCWATTQVDYDLDNIKIELKSGDVYLDDAFTLPAYRRRGIQKALHLHRLIQMRNLGCRRAVLIVDQNNIASQNLMKKLGYQNVDKLSFRRILWRRTYRYHKSEF